jgi:hypothetical protein
MTTAATPAIPPGASPDAPGEPGDSRLRRHVAFFRELDAWTEYWDVYYPETRGRFYFGDGAGEPGLLTRYLPHEQKPPPFVAWTRHALTIGPHAAFVEAVRAPEVAAAVLEVDALLARLFAAHFGNPADPAIRADYLDAIHNFAIDALPPAPDRAARIADEDPRKRTAGRHNIDGDIMWFAWAIHLEAAHAIAGPDDDHARRALMLAGVAAGCPADFAWRGHRRTRPEYQRCPATSDLLRARGLRWAPDFDASAAEVRALYQFREWGHEA